MLSLFQSLEAEGLNDTEKPMFDVLKASLSYPTTDHELANRLADDIVYFCRSAIGDDVYGGILTNAWVLIFDMICCIPSDHAWQDCWVNAIKELKGRETLPARNSDSYDLQWEDLPCFFIELDTHMNRVYEKDIEYQNLNSFVARLYATDVLRDDKFPFAAIRDALERAGGESQDPLLWVASEWLIRCAYHIYESMKFPTPEKRGWWSLGKAFADKDGVAPFSVERWNLWKERISEEREKLLSSKSETAPALAKRLEEALQKMREAEQPSDQKTDVSVDK
ncbi:hypothetical protein F4777DRAFT_23646 [Nemania sp. FL0916]|nr:hypothetical protein F4777DRAFT_23646 [Nemania sp. FL0916]